jgi:hypothetical protein
LSLFRRAGHIFEYRNGFLLIKCSTERLQEGLSRQAGKGEKRFNRIERIDRKEEFFYVTFVVFVVDAFLSPNRVCFASLRERSLSILCILCFGLRAPLTVNQ